ncbi:N-acyl-D-amino-acid deacylase family protein [Tessaracoccus sp.]
MTVIRGARLPDPQGGLGAAVDIHVADGHITSIASSGPGPVTDSHVIDAGGRIAFPGFIDAHVHGEGAVFDPDVQLAMLRQGITSIITGQDGVSYAPSSSTHPGSGHHDAHAWASGYFAAINGEHPTFRGGSVADLLKTYDETTPLNVAYLVPHGTVRFAVMGVDPRPASSDEVDAMVDLLSEGLADGACGLSTGLEYVPGTHATLDELVSLTSVVAARNLPHVSHMRGYEEHAGTAVAELTEIALASGVHTHISHFHGPATELIGHLTEASARGASMTFDSYPYLRGCTILSMIALPTWLPIADPDAAIHALRDPTILARLHTEHLVHLVDLWDRVTLAAVPGQLEWAEGLSLPAAAATLGLSTAETAIEILISTRLRATTVFAQPPTNSATSVAQLLRHASHMAGSDAIYFGGRPHPRGWGTFARFLGVHVREHADWTWAEAQQHLSTSAARRFGLGGRGVLRVGSVADITLVDPDTVADEATYDAPRSPASGIDDVLVRGVPVLADGRLTGRTPGRGLRCTATTDKR